MRRNFHFLAVEEDGELIEHDRDEVRQLLLDLEGSLHHLGGVLTVSAVRQEVGQDAFVTTGMIVAYDSYSPARKRQPEEPPRVDELDLNDNGEAVLEDAGAH